MYIVIKRMIDFLLSYIALFALWPTFLAIAVCIKLDSRGQVIFRQKRVGKDGRIFVLHKFRTMVDNAESLLKQYLHLNEADGPIFKISNDPRLTRIGRFLRDTNLDELPQLINILKGDMSLIGPRPSLPEEIARYKDWQKTRLSVKPGIVCLIQLEEGYPINIKFDRWIRSDLEYINKQSLSIDLLILLKALRKFVIGFFLR